MPIIPLPADNPQGLATFNPMTDPAYRSVARRIADKYLADNGMDPWTWPEDVAEPADGGNAEDEPAATRLAKG